MEKEEFEKFKIETGDIVKDFLKEMRKEALKEGEDISSKEFKETEGFFGQKFLKLLIEKKGIDWNEYQAFLGEEPPEPSKENGLLGRFENLLNESFKKFEKRVKDIDLKFEKQPKISVGKESPKNPKKGDLWIETLEK